MRKKMNLNTITLNEFDKEVNKEYNVRFSYRKSFKKLLNCLKR
jgi:hypothetical protein